MQFQFLFIHHIDYSSCKQNHDYDDEDSKEYAYPFEPFEQSVNLSIGINTELLKAVEGC